MSTVSVTNLKNAASASNNLVLDTSGNTTAAGTVAMGSSYLRNRIINGAMVIDQRNGGAAVTVASGTTNYIVDRFAFTNNASNSVTIQQVADAPADFSYSSKVTIGSANTLGSTQYVDFFQSVEGYNFADMAWGTASAKTITVSFWVKSSVSGTHGGMVINNANNRTFAFTYTISAANTWEYETVTIPGDVTGTWNTTNLRGVGLFFTMGSGATYLTSPNVWTAGVFLAPTTAVNLAAVAGATWQITGVQLEVGTVATPFERRLYGQELVLASRYFQTGNIIIRGNSATSGFVYYSVLWPVQMRSGPSVTLSGTTYSNGSTGGANAPTQYGTEFAYSVSGASSLMQTNYSASAEL